MRQIRSFWIWFTLLFVSWLLALLPNAPDLTTDIFAWKLVSGALFFAAFFLVPLVKDRPVSTFLILLAAAVFAVISMWPASSSGFNPYHLLVYSILAGKSALRLNSWSFGIFVFLLFIGASLPDLSDLPGYPVLFLFFYFVILYIGLSWFRTILLKHKDASVRSETLLSEYRSMKRRLLLDEQTARQDERVQIGRDIHDSVGHKLTALLMQLEMHRMNSDGETSNMLHGLKLLAKESLEETRSAVKSLNHQEVGGLSAIIGLLKRLESETVMRIHLTARHGALTTPLNQIQSTVIYRAVQEALTNAMKHGLDREVHILFEAPGGGIFRFEVMNAHHKDKRPLREGYGLKSMRERITDAGGTLEILEYDNQFIVRGNLHIVNHMKEEYI